MFDKLNEITNKPKPFEYYTAAELWTNAHTAKKMLQYHLDSSHDIASRNGEFISQAIDWIVSRFELDKDSQLIDFGCGPGLYTSRFAERGIETTGIDFSQGSINYAKKQAKERRLKIDYIQENYLDYIPSQKADLITMIMYDFCSLSPEQRAKMLRKFREILKPGGAILLDVLSLKSFEEKEELSSFEINHMDHFWSPENYYCFVNVFKYPEERLVLDKYSLFERESERTVYNWLQYYSPGALKKEFRDCELDIFEVYSDISGSDYAEDSLQFAVVAKVI